MVSGNYVVIMITLMFIYVYMHVHKSLSDRVIRDHECFMLMILHICMYLCHCLTGPSEIVLVEE